MSILSSNPEPDYSSSSSTEGQGDYQADVNGGSMYGTAYGNEVVIELSGDSGTTILHFEKA